MSDARMRAWPATTDEFLSWPGDGRAKRYELVDGQVRAMSPGSVVHGVIQATLTAMIRQHLRDADSPCKVLTEPAVQPRLRAATNVRVPDIGVTCSPIGVGQVVMENPVVLIEVLSPSNHARTWSNVSTYATVPSVREIAVVHSAGIAVQVLRATADRLWPDNPETLAAGDTFRLDSIRFAVPVRDICADTPLG